MGKILDRDDVEDTRNWQCRDGNDLSDDRLNNLCDSHEALRDLLRLVVAGVGRERVPGSLRAEVDAAVEVARTAREVAGRPILPLPGGIDTVIVIKEKWEV